MAMKQKQTTGKSCTQKRDDNNKARGVTRRGKRPRQSRQLQQQQQPPTFYCCLTKNGDVGAGRDGFGSQRFGGNSATIAAGMAGIGVEQGESSIP